MDKGKNIIKTYALLFLFMSLIPIHAQDHEIDTLYLRHDDPLLSIEKHVSSSARVFRIKGTGTNGFTYLLEKDVFLKNHGIAVSDLKITFKNSDIYFTSNHINSQKRGLINDWKLLKFFENYIIFLVKNDSLIKVNVIHEIE